MLTKDLVLYRCRGDRVRPSFVDATDRGLLELSQELIATAADAPGKAAGSVESALAALAAGHRRLRVAKGMAKLVGDRLQVEEPDGTAQQRRAAVFATAAEVLRALPDDASLADYQSQLAARTSETERRDLYADLPQNRRVEGWKPLEPTQLIERYNMALAQGLVLQAHEVRIEAPAPELLRVRRVLRWLKFCRLVADVRCHEGSWAFHVSGPASILSMQKKYGLQLATFLPVIPTLGRFTVQADVVVGRSKRRRLELTEADPLVCPYRNALGHIPPEITKTVESFQDDAWTVDLVPQPRPVGATAMCVPDLGFHHRDSDQRVFVELFHRWHDGPLRRRLAELQQRPDPHLVLGIDRALVRAEGLGEQVAGDDRLFEFNAFPSASKLRQVLQNFDLSG